MRLLTDGDFNMRRKFYEESKRFAIRKNIKVNYKCDHCGFISTSNVVIPQCPMCGRRLLPPESKKI